MIPTNSWLHIVAPNAKPCFRMTLEVKSSFVVLNTKDFHFSYSALSEPGLLVAFARNFPSTAAHHPQSATPYPNH